MAITSVMFILLALLCAGCGQDRPIMTDDATGCQFWFNDSHNISPRMGADGKQICREVVK